MQSRFKSLILFLGSLQRNYSRELVFCVLWHVPLTTVWAIPLCCGHSRVGGSAFLLNNKAIHLPISYNLDVQKGLILDDPSIITSRYYSYIFLCSFPILNKLFLIWSRLGNSKTRVEHIPQRRSRMDTFDTLLRKSNRPEPN